MAQVLEAGLAEVLREHEDKIAAAQAWCGNKHLFHPRAQVAMKPPSTPRRRGAIKVLDGFIIKRRVGARPPPPPPPSVRHSRPRTRTTMITPRTHRDTHAYAAFAPAPDSPGLEMPCVRAATATVGVLLGRADGGSNRRPHLAMAFAVPTDEERRAEAAKFVEDYGGTKNIAAAPMGANPPTRMRPSPPPSLKPWRTARMTAVAANAHLVSLADAPGHDLIIFSDEGYTSVDFNKQLRPLSLVGCETLTIRRRSHATRKSASAGACDIREAGDTESRGHAFFTANALPPNTFTAPRRSSSGRGYFAIADSRAGSTCCPRSGDSCRQRPRRQDVNDGNLSFGRFKSPNAYGDISFGTAR